MAHVPNPTKRRTAFSCHCKRYFNKGITTSGNKVEIATGAALAMTICSALLVMTFDFLQYKSPLEEAC